MEEFKAYLKKKRFTQRTAEEHCRNIKHFTDWMKQENYLNAATIRYNDLLAYINYEKQRNLSPATINVRLSSISHYFECLKKLGEVERNPARSIRVKGTIETVIQNPLNQKELESLYQQYSNLKKVAHRQKEAETVHLRNIVIAGLLIFQGIHTGELSKMEVGHINMDASTVYIPSTTRSSSRVLELSSRQIVALHQYLTSVRSYFKPKGEELIPGGVQNITYGLIYELQGLNPIISNAQHIRGSVILSWLKIHSKRQVQYMAGHKYISSTEKYASQEIEDLQDALTKHHPFG